jgi:hypothetical protein
VQIAAGHRKIHLPYPRYCKGWMSAARPAYLELVDFIAAGTTPEPLIAFRPSEGVQNRVKELGPCIQPLNGINLHFSGELPSR